MGWTTAATEASRLAPGRAGLPSGVASSSAQMFSESAPVYDLIYEASGKDYAAESADVDALIQARDPGARRLLDVGCGTGGHLRHLRAHYDVFGVDLDPHMLAEARKHLGEIPLVEADMRTLALGTAFDAVICLFSVVGYMRSTAELDTAIGALARHLRPGGVLIVDGWVRPDAWREGSTFVQVATSDEMKVARVGRSRRDGTTTHLEMHYLIATTEAVDHLVEHHALTLFSPQDYETALERAGLTVEVVDGPMDGRDRYLGVKAR